MSALKETRKGPFICALETYLVLNWVLLIHSASKGGGMGRKRRLPELRAGPSCKDTFTNGEPASPVNS